MIDLRKDTSPSRWLVKKTNYSSTSPTQLKWDFEIGLVTEEDPNDEPTETDDDPAADEQTY